MNVGYARVSTKDQNIDLQLTALKAAQCEKIFTDIATGGTLNRDGLTSLFSHLRKGDTLVVWRLDRLGRNVKDLVTLVQELDVKGIAFKSLHDAIDTTSATGKFFFNIMAALSQMERDLIRERTKAGLEIAKKNGRLPGRKRKMTDKKIITAKKLLDSGMSIKEISESIEVSVPTIYRHLKIS